VHRDQKVWIRGAGELASATAYSLHQAGFQIVMSDLAEPLAIRRRVSFSDAIHTGQTSVEGVIAVKGAVADVPDILEQGRIALVIDSPDLQRPLKPDILIDARMLKRPVTNIRANASFSIGLGPGFHAGRDCDAVIETQRGHDLGKTIWEGTAKPSTGIPGMIAGETIRRVLYARVAGTVSWSVDIGDLVEADDVIGRIGSTHELQAPLSGLVRGLISPLSPVTVGLKIADIDPRGREVDHQTISDKARAVGRGVLEAVLIFLNNPEFKNAGKT
jgi:xanthine dehydrogenase accessory factor